MDDPDGIEPMTPHDYGHVPPTGPLTRFQRMLLPHIPAEWAPAADILRDHDPRGVGASLNALVGRGYVEFTMVGRRAHYRRAHPKSVPPSPVAALRARMRATSDMGPVWDALVADVGLDAASDMWDAACDESAVSS